MADKYFATNCVNANKLAYCTNGDNTDFCTTCLVFVYTDHEMG